MARAPRQREIAYSNPFLMTIGEEPVSSSRFPKWGQLLALRGTGPGVFAAYSRASALVARRSSCFCLHAFLLPDPWSAPGIARLSVFPR